MGAMVMGAMMMAMAACGGSEKAADAATDQETTEVTAEEVAVDTTVVCSECDGECADSVVARAAGESQGFGRCLQSGCHCKEFEGRGQTCRNCGHAYKKHY